MLRFTVPGRTLRLNRYWRAFFYGLCGIALAGALALAFAPRLAGLFLLALYCIPSNSVLPIPHEPGVLYFARFYDPAWIALAATTASVIVSFADYAIVEAAMKKPSLSGAQHSRVFRWAVRWMQRWPFAIVSLFSLVPLLPISVIRVLAPASGYSIRRYVVAQIVGRLPRFYLLAWLGQTLEFPSWALGLMFVLLLVTFWLTGRGDGEAAPGPAGVADEDGDPADVAPLAPASALDAAAPHAP